MDWIQKKAGVISAILIAAINALASFGIVLPTGVDAQGVALANTAALSIAALVIHLTARPTSV